MCVILICPKEKPSDAMVEAAFDTNRDGVGIAWRDGGRVHWKKGLLSVEEALELVAATAPPFVLHFRIPTVGGKRKELAHPFPISKTSSLALEGSTKDFVLFHNGHWNRWREFSLDAALHSNTKLPGGKWSDSRAMAWNAAIYGLSFLELVDEKFVAFGPGDEDIEVNQGGWTLVDGVWCSNTNWQSRPAWNRRNRKEVETVDLRPHQGSVGGYHTTPPHSLPTGFGGRPTGGSEVVTLPNEEDDHLAVVERWNRLKEANNHGVPSHNRKGSRGTPPPIPFGQVHPEVARGMWQREEISKKQYKKYCKVWDVNQRKKEKEKRRKERESQPILH